MLVDFNLEGLEEKDVREIKFLLQEINDTLDAGIWKINIRGGTLAGVLSDNLYNTKIGTEALHSNITSSRNIAIGYQTLHSITKNSYTEKSNIAIGYQALYENTHLGYGSIALGYRALYANVSGYGNTAIGYQALESSFNGDLNIALGNFSLLYNITGDENIAIGSQTLYANTTGDDNTAVGANAIGENISGNKNVAIGYAAGLYLLGSGNICLGYYAGAAEEGSNKLYIDNSNTSTPLIYGEFDNNFIEIHGNLGIGTRVFGTSATRTLAMINGTIPSSSPVNAIQLYAEDVANSSELKVRDEATNIATLSPHNFELFKPDKDDPLPWSYHSINQLIGKKVNADISGALRELEQLSGKKFLYYEDVNKISLDEYMEERKEQLITNYIAENGSEIEVEKDEAWGEVETEIQDTKTITGYDTKYEFDEKTGKIKETKKPKYGKKTVLKNKLKKGYRFNKETGKFLKTVKPTKAEAEKAIKKELVIPKWIEDRINGE